MSSKRQQKKKTSPVKKSETLTRSSSLPISIMIAVRAIYVLIIILLAIDKQWGGVIFQGAIFLITLIIPYFGRKERDYYVLDSFVIGMFMLALIFTSTGMWDTTPPTIWGMMTHSDKIFHTYAGMVLAMFAAITIRWQFFNNAMRETTKETTSGVNQALVFYLFIIIFAIAIGAVWEIYEWIMSVLPAPFTIPSSGYADSMLDLVADTLGATLVVVVLWTRRYL